MPHRKNFLLSQLDPAALERLGPYLTLTELRQGQVLAETHQRVERVYFPHSGIISCLVELKDGGAIGTGMIGNDGAFGAAEALDDKVSFAHVVVQVAATASVISTDRVREAADELPNFRSLLIKSELFFLTQVQQTAACNAAHNVRRRSCRWLLRMHDLIGPELPLTHEYLAQILGVRRTSVTGAARELQQDGMITYRRGLVRIVDLELIRQSACECNDDVRSHFRSIFSDAAAEWSNH